jgi:nucleotide-binding universal stress UspA family protein
MASPLVRSVRHGLPEDAMTTTIRRILVPTDFSATSDAALEWAKTIAGTLGASLHLLHVFEDPYVGAVGAPFAAEAYLAAAPELGAARFEEAGARLSHRLSANEHARYRATSRIVAGASVPTILDYAREHHIDLIVMGTHGRTGLAHVLLGSVTERVVRLADCPVLTVHQRHAKAEVPYRAYLPEMPVEVAS